MRIFKEIFDIVIYITFIISLIVAMYNKSKGIDITNFDLLGAILLCIAVFSIQIIDEIRKNNKK